MLSSSILLFPLLTAASALTVYHRVYIPGVAENSFVERGVIDSSLFQPSPSLSQQWPDFEKALESLSSTPHITLDRVLYQVALKREGSEWDISSVKLCHLPFISSQTLILHTPHASASLPPYAIDYFVSPIPADGSCPSVAGAAATLASPFRALSNINTTVVHKSATLPPLPQLRTPPPLTAEGAPVQPVPEKSFIQKYWMYVAAIVVALMMTGGAPEEEGQSAGR
ncbi:hypothetical protein BDP27DRAFT_1312576 [Rhodocollybia butyracea]|uniref:ER membrane protein complex subunit 10 n=1 Tax=Rhodocollybia butyracea TaxID=206335 RepID=A0A9P5Q1V0_9AGAR|nr:hypothetical protein BDP27DRAFT_1312576 [Rhodocollybia butyracea]